MFSYQQQNFINTHAKMLEATKSPTSGVPYLSQGLLAGICFFLDACTYEAAALLS
jgi:hypothetical protein